MSLKIQIENKLFGSKQILKNINLEITENGIYGIYGKNGTGKTTFFNCILNLTSFQGRILFDDKPLKTNEIAYVPTEPIIYEYLNSDEFMKFFRLKVLNQNSDNLNPVFENLSKDLLKNQSTGMKKKTYINAVLQSENYKLYIFDEPFNGLDIESNYILLNKIKEIAKNNIVFVSSHILEIIEEFSNKNYLLHNQMIKEEKIENIKQILTLNEKDFSSDLLYLS